MGTGQQQTASMLKHAKLENEPADAENCDSDPIWNES